MSDTQNDSQSNNNRLLIIEDDESFAAILARRLERHDYQVSIANSTSQGLSLAESVNPNYVLLDMKIGDDNGIHILPQLRQLLPNSRIILLTGYASIATAVESIKSGADDYLSKPIDGASLLAALNGGSNDRASGRASGRSDGGLNGRTNRRSQRELKHGEIQHDSLETSMSPARMEWEHIQQVLKMNQGNISETARQLGMHRRTLQRKLAQKAPVS
jgi:two-component system response regulator RegA